jgi:hypothetical protein
MTCVMSLVAHGNEQLSVAVVFEPPWATLRFRIPDEPVELRVETADALALVRALLRATQQLCAAAAAADSTTLPEAGWGRAALLVDDVLVVLTGQSGQR